MQLQDQTGRNLNFLSIPERIVSLVPSQTELIVDMGLEQNLVGITKFCVHPPNLRKNKSIVGGTKQIHLDKIRALNPDLILCNKEENTLQMVMDLEKIAPVHVSDVVRLEDSFVLMRQYAGIFERKALVENFISTIKNKIRAFRQQLHGASKKRVAYFIWNNPLMVAGASTFINSMLELNNFENIFKEERYPKTSLEELNTRNADMILLSSEPFPFTEKHKEIFRGVNAEVRLVDGAYFSWYGTRLIKALDYFKGLHAD